MCVIVTLLLLLLPFLLVVLLLLLSYSFFVRLVREEDEDDAVEDRIGFTVKENRKEDEYHCKVTQLGGIQFAL